MTATEPRMDWISDHELNELAEEVSEMLINKQKDLTSGDDRSAYVIHAATQVASGWIQAKAKEETILHNGASDELAETLRYQILGTGPLGPLLRNGAEYSDLHFNGARAAFAKLRRNGQKERIDNPFRSEGELLALVKKLITAYAPNEPRFDAGQPFVGINLPTGERVHAILNVTEPVSLVVRFPDYAISRLTDLVANNTISVPVATFLKAMVDARLNVIIAGATGAGKTTLLRVLLNEVNPQERIITIEDDRELHLDKFPELNPNVLSAESVPPNVDGKGGIGLEVLLREMLRQDPDRLCVGEVRGEEALQMFEAMSIGNDGSMCSLHANSAQAIVPRLIQCARSDPRHVCIAIANAVDIFVHVEKTIDGKRITEIREVDTKLPEAEGIVHSQAIWQTNQQGTLQYNGCSPALALRLSEAGWNATP